MSCPMRVRRPATFLGVDGRSVEVLPEGEVVLVLEDWEIRDALGPLGLRAWIPGARAPDQGWLDLMSWFGRKSQYGYPRIPPPGRKDTPPQWIGTKDRHPDSCPFMWNGRFRYLDADQLEVL